MTDSQSIQYMVKDAQGNIYGPATIPILRQWIAEHRVLGSMNIAPQGTNDWQLVSAHPQLADVTADPAPAAASTGVVATVQSAMSQSTPISSPYTVTSNPVSGDHITAGSTSPLAIASMITGIVSIPLSCVCIGGLAGAAAIIMGLLAAQRIKQQSNVKGYGMAMAGIAAGAAGILLTILMVALFFVIHRRAPLRPL